MNESQLFEGLEAAMQYGERWAPVYDEWHPFDDNAAAAVTALAQLSNGGRVLELAIGSGRLALPLRARGVEISGIDASPAMVDLLRSKPDGDAIPVAIGNFRDVGVDGTFDLIFVAYNTLFALPTQDDQVDCFANVAAHLTDDGRFVVECFVPTPKRLAMDGHKVQPWKLTDETARFHLLEHDPVAQHVRAQTVDISVDGNARLFPSRVRYAWPSELDLMARLAGMRLRYRWSDWSRSPFTGESTAHVSVYERA